MDMNQYLDIFIEESKEHLQYMNENLLNLEKAPSDKNILNEIFRVAHTLKGMSGTMGFSKIASLTHEMENVLHSVRNDELKVDTKLIDILFQCFDTLDEYVTYIGNNGVEGEHDSNELIAALNDLFHNANSAENLNAVKEFNNGNVIDEYVMSVIKKANEKGLKAYNIDIKLNDNCMLKSARAFIVFNTLEEHSEIIHSIPSVEDIEDEKFDSSFRLTIVSSEDKDLIAKDLLSISEIEIVDICSIQTNVDVINSEENKEEVKAKETSNTKETESSSDIQNKRKQNNLIGKTVRVDIDRLDNLMNLVSELIIIKTRMEDMSSNLETRSMGDTIEYLERITSNLHDAVMKVRMVPIERVFNRFPRMVRDLAKELGKEINLEMSGEETEVDRTVIDEIGDPLIHLIRNSIDHGIESPVERVRANKGQAGTVKLKAYPDGNNVVIEVEDDGDGIDVDKVKRKSVERGLVSEAKANELTKEEIIDLLFKAGFSTADTISDISGRGVGLDVVKTKIESIGGIVEVETNKGYGSKFIIRLPLTLAIIQALLINLGEEIFAIPLSSISEINTVDCNSIRKIQNQEVILFRNKTLPLIRLNGVLGVESKINSNEITIVIVKKGDKEAGLIVDNLIGQQEIVIKTLGKYLTGIKYLAGATILGNGKISLILDVNSLF